MPACSIPLPPAANKPIHRCKPHASQISNYARPGFQSRHNRAYWENVPFYAFGNGAASYVDGHRFSRPRGLPEYGRWVDSLAEEGWAKATGASAAAGGAGGDEQLEQKERRKGPSFEALERVSERFCGGFAVEVQVSSRVQCTRLHSQRILRVFVRSWSSWWGGRRSGVLRHTTHPPSHMRWGLPPLPSVCPYSFTPSLAKT